MSAAGAKGPFRKLQVSDKLTGPLCLSLSETAGVEPSRRRLVKKEEKGEDYSPFGHLMIGVALKLNELEGGCR